MSELAARAQITKQSMAELVAHLEQYGYVERIPDPADGRAKLVRATIRGRAVFPPTSSASGLQSSARRRCASFANSSKNSTIACQATS